MRVATIKIEVTRLTFSFPLVSGYRVHDFHGYSIALSRFTVPLLYLLGDHAPDADRWTLR